jgi:hypothetical protein
MCTKIKNHEHRQLPPPAFATMERPRDGDRVAHSGVELVAGAMLKQMSTVIKSTNYDAESLLLQMSEREDIEAGLEALGFARGRNAVIRGFKPHYMRGEDLVFISSANSYLGRVVSMSIAYEDHPGKVYMVVTDAAPDMLTGDLIASKKLIPLKMCPVRTAQYGMDGIEWVPYSL